MGELYITSRVFVTNGDGSVHRPDFADFHAHCEVASSTAITDGLRCNEYTILQHRVFLASTVKGRIEDPLDFLQSKSLNSISLG